MRPQSRAPLASSIMLETAHIRQPEAHARFFAAHFRRRQSCSRTASKIPGSRPWCIILSHSGGQMRRTPLPLVFIGLLTATVAQCQLVDEYNPPRSTCCLPNAVKTLADQIQDWDQLGRYHAAHVDLKTQPADPKRVVFMGDSITDGWRLAEYFPDKPYVNRGISGQTTPQMVVRMYPDVVDLKPAAVVILAGTNDIARNTGPETAEMIEDNFMAMTDIAQRNGIKVVLCSVMSS